MKRSIPLHSMNHLEYYTAWKVSFSGSRIRFNEHICLKLVLENGKSIVLACTPFLEDVNDIARPINTFFEVPVDFGPIPDQFELV